MNLSYSKGQVMPLILFMLAVGSILMVVMFNTTQKATDKSVATNAADAAAYSAGVWVSRNLNFMAYTNRAMVANHVAVGHLVTYVSWMRYVASTAGNINTIGQFIPYLSTVTSMLRRSSSSIKRSAEASARIIVPSVDEINRLIHASQIAAVADLRPGVVNNLMSEIVMTYDPRLGANNTNGLQGSGNQFAPLIDASLAAQNAALLGAVQVMSPQSDGGKMRSLVEMSYAGSERWFNNRSWSRRLLVIFKLRKRASTTHSMSGGLSEWRASDSLAFGRFSKGRWRWSTIGSGSANTSSFDNNYKGIHGYTQMRGDTWLTNSDYPLYMDLVTLATKSDTATAPHRRMQIESKGTSISGFGRARVFFKKPAEGFSGHANEFSNLLNPFWNVKLVDPWP